MVARAAIQGHLSRGDLSDGRIFDAVRVRLIEVGEAVKALPAEQLAREPDLPWSAIARMRDRLAHHYFDTEHSHVAETVKHDLGPLEAAVRRLAERLHLRETWSSVAVADITPQQVRLWHEAAAHTARPTALVQSYRLLRALLNVAVADEVLATNPCRLRAAGIASSARPSRSLTVAEVQSLAGKIPARYRALILTLAFEGLRFGEATGLRRQDVSADSITVTGGTQAAATGASTKDLMHRLGHSSPAASLIYQHASTCRDSEIARALDALVTDPKVVASRPPSEGNANRASAVGGAS